VINVNPSFSPGEKELDHSCSTPAVLAAAQETSSNLTCLRELMEPGVHWSPGTAKNEKNCLQIHEGLRSKLGQLVMFVSRIRPVTVFGEAVF
jgi:hypothetical protein